MTSSRPSIELTYLSIMLNEISQLAVKLLIMSKISLLLTLIESLIDIYFIRETFTLSSVNI
ncbi:Uncharacterised protein [Vibrio cholerae]|nr:Uncharacterised protein [Vibrio cholerae]